MKIQNSKFVVRLTLILSILCHAFSVAPAQESEQAAKDAIAALTAKIAAAPNNDVFYAQRANYYLGFNKFDEALADANLAIKLNPKNNGALIVRGAVKLNKKDYDGAIADYSEVIRLYPTRAFRAYFFRGGAYEAKGEYDKALADYEKAGELDKSIKDAVLNSQIRVYDKQLKATGAKYAKTPAAESVIPDVWKDGDFAVPDSPLIVAKIVSHDGKKVPGVIVLGKQLKSSGFETGDIIRPLQFDSYPSIKAVKADSMQTVGYKVILGKPGGGKFYVYEGFALDFDPNDEFRLPPRLSNVQNPDFKTDKLGFKQSVMLIKKNVTVGDAKLEVFDILDLYSNLSLVRRQPFPITNEKKAYADLLDGELKAGNYDEAKAVYQHLEKLAATASETNETKQTRKTNLAKLYRASADLNPFVEQEMTKYKYTEAEKQAIKTGNIPR